MSYRSFLSLSQAFTFLFQSQQHTSRATTPTSQQRRQSAKRTIRTKEEKNYEKDISRANTNLNSTHPERQQRKMSSPAPSTTSATDPHAAPKTQEQITFRFCRECSNMLYPKEDRMTNKLMFACRTCQFSEEAQSSCVFRNNMYNTVGETAGVTQDVGSDPTVGDSFDFNVYVEVFCCTLCGREMEGSCEEEDNDDDDDDDDNNEDEMEMGGQREKDEWEKGVRSNALFDLSELSGMEEEEEEEEDDDDDDNEESEQEAELTLSPPPPPKKTKTTQLTPSLPSSSPAPTAPVQPAKQNEASSSNPNSGLRKRAW
ncbi:hypothetical protein N7G274_001096 [Stereocaulon virgatum]|uniref:DNA-directed RNA polymerase II subunit RPB9-like zinc ribbon domain-containing protein n=1 Tax=Stereocaulon virgatum TaxID=373712 RepID=A0ABR4AMV8_9LECA